MFWSVFFFIFVVSFLFFWWWAVIWDGSTLRHRRSVPSCISPLFMAFLSIGFWMLQLFTPGFPSENALRSELPCYFHAANFLNACIYWYFSRQSKSLVTIVPDVSSGVEIVTGLTSGFRLLFAVSGATMLCSVSLLIYLTLLGRLYRGSDVPLLSILVAFGTSLVMAWLNSELYRLLRVTLEQPSKLSL